MYFLFLIFFSNFIYIQEKHSTCNVFVNFNFSNRNGMLNWTDIFIFLPRVWHSMPDMRLRNRGHRDILLTFLCSNATGQTLTQHYTRTPWTLCPRMRLQGDHKSYSLNEVMEDSVTWTRNSFNWFNLFMFESTCPWKDKPTGKSSG